jgi:hypothetical protein
MKKLRAWAAVAKTLAILGLGTLFLSLQPGPGQD